MRKHLLPHILIISLVLFSIVLISFLGCSDNKWPEKSVISEQDAEYIVKGTDADTGEFDPDTPQKASKAGCLPCNYCNP